MHLLDGSNKPGSTAPCKEDMLHELFSMDRMNRKKKEPTDFKHKHNLIREISASLKKRKPTIYFAEDDYEQNTLRDVDAYFTTLWEFCSASTYKKWVKCYIDENMSALHMAQGFDIKGDVVPVPVPLSKSHYAHAWVSREMPRLWELTKRRGRPPSKINDAIIDILSPNLKMKALLVCKELDSRKIPVLKKDSWSGIKDWKSAYRETDLKKSIETRISKIRKSLAKKTSPHRY